MKTINIIFKEKTQIPEITYEKVYKLFHDDEILHIWQLGKLLPFVYKSEDIDVYILTT